MVVNSSVSKALIALALVSAPGAVGFAAVADGAGLPVFAAFTSNDSPDDFGGEVLEEFTFDFDVPVTSGALDLRIDHGHVFVKGWDQDAYLVQVLTVPQDQPLIGQRETIVEFTDNSADGVLDLAMIVDHRGDGGVSARVADSGSISIGGDNPQTAIVAYVPATASYDTVRLCSGEAYEFGIELPGVVPSETSDPACMAADENEGFAFDASIESGNGTGLDVPFAVEGLNGAQLTVLSDYDDVTLTDLQFDAIDVETDYGDVFASAVTAEGIDLTTDYGDVFASDLDAPTFQVETDYGDIVIENVVTSEAALTTDDGDVLLTNLDFGTLDVETDYGDVIGDVLVGTELSTTTDDGDVLLSDVTISAFDGETDYGGIILDELTATSVEASTGYGEILMSDLRTDQLSVETDDGDIIGDIEAVDVRGVSDYGNIELSGVFDNAELETDDGDIILEIAPRASGTWSLTSGYGDIMVNVPEDDAIGYDVQAATGYGEILVELADAQTSSNDDEDGSADVHVRSVDFDSRPIQVEMIAFSDDGDILIADGSNEVAAAESGDGDGADDGDTNSTAADDLSGLVDDVVSASTNGPVLETDRVVIAPRADVTVNLG